MRGLLWLIAGTLIAGTLSTGCSLLGLDEVKPTPCASVGERDLSAAHALCARELSDIPLESCEAAVCAAQVDGELFCVIGTPDADGDGIGDGACIDEGSSDRPRDCDDDDPDVGEGRAELCDGKDNDCDGRVDEGVLVAGEPTRRDADPGDTEGVVAATAAGETVAAAFGRELDPNAPRARYLNLLLGAIPIAPTVAGSAVRLNDPATEAADPGLALTGDDSSTFVVFPAAGCDRLSVGVVTGSELSSASFAPADSSPRTGLPSMGSNACSDDVAQRAPAVARNGNDVVIAWLQSGARGACGTGQRAPLLATTSDATAALTTDSLDLAMANDAGPPSLLYVASADLYVLAYGDGTELVLRTLRLSSSGLEAVSSARVDLDAPVQETALTLGPLDDDDATLGVAASVGCGSRAEVVFQRVRLARSTGEVQAAGTPDRVDGGGEQRRPALAFGQTRPRGFFVLWAEDDARVRGQLLDVTQGVSGPAFDVMGPTNFDGETPTRLRGLGVAPVATGGFETLAHVRHAMPGFYAATVLCGSE